MRHDFVPQLASDWCGLGWGSDCNTINLTPWTGSDNVKIAFETYSMYGNPIFIDNVFVDRFVSVEQNIDENFDVFPNPAHTYFTVSWKSTGKSTGIKLLNTLGIVVLSKTIDDTNDYTVINCSTLKNGIYMLIIQNGNSTFNKKVLIVK